MDETKKFTVVTVSFLVLGNCLGVGVLALPIKYGLAGFWPALLGICFIWLLMLISALVIARKICTAKSETFDIPWFFKDALGAGGKWLAIACNLILLYGVLTAYLSGMSTMIDQLCHPPVNKALITLVYFIITTGLILFGTRAYQKGNLLVIIAVWVCFILLVISGARRFDPALLRSAQWKYFPIGIPVAVSAFHFHNIIPTVARSLRHDFPSTRKAIFLGIFLGLIINLVWVTVVLGSLERVGPDPDTIEESYWHQLPANVPMEDLLHSRVFFGSSFVFAVLAVTASYMANGTGLRGFIRNLTSTYLHTENKMLIAAVAFLPPLGVTLVYPDIFLGALDIVGGLGEAILFIALPGLILIRMAKRKSSLMGLVGGLMFVIGCLITAYVIADKAGLIDLVKSAGPA